MTQSIPADALWESCLGFLDWDVEQTLRFQERLLTQQLERLSAGSLGRSLLGTRPIRTSTELREAVPLTDYDTYTDTLGERRTDVLDASPASWMVTSGRANGLPKWVPLSNEARDQLGYAVLGLFVAGTASERGDVALPDSLRLLNMTAPPPYMSGTAVAAFTNSHLWPNRLFPPDDRKVDAMPFEERMAMGFKDAFEQGVDIVMSYSSVLAGIGSSFRRGQVPLPPGIPSPEPGRVPRDLWAIRAVIAGGTDARLFREQITEQWGRPPLELLASTECLFYGMQTWDHDTSTLIPHFNYFEFIPSTNVDDRVSAPGNDRTVTLDEVAVGETYELVVTNLLGGALVRYRTGELLRVAALANAATGVQLPQFEYFGQRTELIEVGGFARLSEAIIQRALAASGLELLDWTARKEVTGGSPVVHIRIELAPGAPVMIDAEARVDAALRNLDLDWRDLEDIAQIRPLKISVLPSGSFARSREATGARSLPRVNPPHGAVEVLDRAGAMGGVL